MTTRVIESAPGRVEEKLHGVIMVDAGRDYSLGDPPACAGEGWERCRFSAPATLSNARTSAVVMIVVMFLLLGVIEFLQLAGVPMGSVP